MNATDNLHIETYPNDTFLVGTCLNPTTGRWKLSRLRLDGCLGDEHGRFLWGGQEFTENAHNITFNAHEGASDVPVLRADLRDDAGNYHPKDVNLAERIKNNNGYLTFY